MEQNIFFSRVFCFFMSLVIFLIFTSYLNSVVFQNWPINNELRDNKININDCIEKEKPASNSTLHFKEMLQLLREKVPRKKRELEICKSRNFKEGSRIFYNRIPKAGSRTLFFLLTNKFDQRKYTVRSILVRVPFVAQSFTEIYPVSIIILLD